MAKELRLTSVYLLVLAVLLERPMHAYGIRQEIMEISEPQRYKIRHSSLYTVLTRLKAEGLIEQCYSTPFPWLDRHRGEVYELTKHGEFRLQKELMLHRQLIIGTKMALLRRMDNISDEHEARRAYRHWMVAWSKLPERFIDDPIEGFDDLEGL